MGGHVPETDSAQTEFAHICPGTSTNLTAVVSPNLEFRFLHRFIPERFPGQILLLQFIDALMSHRGLLIAKRHPHQSQQFFAFLIGLGRGNDTDIEAFNGVDLIVIDFGKYNVFLYAERVVAATVKG